MAKTYTQDDVDRIVQAAVDYASQKAAQEARAVALEEAVKVVAPKRQRAPLKGGGPLAPVYRDKGATTAIEVRKQMQKNILALLDTPAAEALAARDERVRAEERERVHAAIRAGGET